MGLIMSAIRRDKGLWVLLFVVVSVLVLQRGMALSADAASGRSRQEHSAVSHEVLTFYYPWYGVPDGPGGAGRTVHWGRIDAAKKDIQASTNYPALGAYDSHDPKLIEKHCQWAKRAGIDTLIVSWWGHNSFSDRAMDKILDGCQRHGLTACIYYETVPRPRTSESAADDIVKVLEKYGGHPAHLKVHGKPVVFVYGRALQELGLTAWLKAIEIVNAKYEDGVAAMGDQFSYGAARVFDGIHTYNTCGKLRGMAPGAARKWAAETYPSWVRMADEAGKISTLTVIPGYDDTKIRKPGLAVKRYEGELYRVQWEEAIKADPHWVLITSFNEWHEGSEIEPSLEYEEQYIDLTAEYTKRFKAKKRTIRSRADSGQFNENDKARLREKLGEIRIGVLPGAESMAFWWLLDVGVKPEVLAWEEVADGLSPKQCQVLLYCAGEHYRRSVEKTGDVDDALVSYLKAGGYIVFLPALPWPFHYDENNQVVNRSGQFGLTLRGAWESPQTDTKLNFVQPQRRLSRVPEKFGFPTSGDQRWRPFFAGDKHTSHTSLLVLRDADDNYLGDAVAYAELKGGGRIMYTWFGLLQGPYAEALLYDVFDFLASQIGQSGS